MSAIAEVTKDDFERQVLQSSKPVLVDFWAPWCGPCRALAPVLEKVAQQFAGEVTFLKLNTDEHPDIRERYGVRGIPTLIFFKGGQAVDRMVGGAPAGTIASMLSPSDSSKAIAEVTEADFEQQVLQSGEPVLVHFGPPQRSSYRMMVPIIEDVAQKFAGQVKFFSLNTDQNPNISERYKTTSSCLLLFKGGHVVDRLEGVIPEDTIISMFGSSKNKKAIAEVTEADFEQKVLQGRGLILVDFWAPYMGTYRRAARIVEERFAGRVEYLKLNVDENPNIRERYKIRSNSPYLVLFENGQVIGHIPGYVGGPNTPEDEVASMLSSWEKENENGQPGVVAEVTPRDFEQKVLQSNEPVLVFFGTSWMGSYNRAARVVGEKFAGRVKFFKLNTDESPDICERYEVHSSMPSLILFKDGEVVDRTGGYIGSRDREDEIALILSSWQEDNRGTKAIAEVTPADFEQKVLQSGEPVVVHVGALWMGSYHKPAQVVEERFAGQLAFFKLNIDKDPDFKERYQLKGIPCLVLFRDGHVVDRIYGIASQDRVAEELSKHLIPA